MSILSISRIPQTRGYAALQVAVVDTSNQSPLYFDITHLPSRIGGGKSVIALRGNGTNLAFNSVIDVEIVDAAGKNVWCEFVNFVDRFNQYYISIEVHGSTAAGLADVYLVGRAKYDVDGAELVPEPGREFNLRWQGQIELAPNERNDSSLLFDKSPKVLVSQVYGPARLQTQATSSGYVFSVITSSANLLSIVDSNFKGYDRDFSSSPDILDVPTRNLLVHPTGGANTMNTVDTGVRRRDRDIQGGFRVDQIDRYGTMLLASEPFFKKEHLGGQFEFYNSDTTPKVLLPDLPPNATLSGSAQAQLEYYSANVVSVVSDRHAIISKPLVVTTTDSRSTSRDYKSTHRYTQASRFTGSIVYAPSDITFVESLIVSQSYLEFTFNELRPIAGEVHRIKTYTKRGASTGEFKLLNDQVIQPVEYLSDAALPNNTSYAQIESDHLLTGYFSSNSILESYWTVLSETPGSIDPILITLSNDVLIQAAELQANYTQSALLASRFNQNYNVDEHYTLSINTTLQPHTELEVYMSSTNLNYSILSPSLYPQAFISDVEVDRTRNGSGYSVFGKLIGKITNDSPVQKHYGRVQFDFATDASGFGKPVFRVRAVDEDPNVAGKGYVSDISIKPLKPNGFTPSIVQFSVPLTVELATFFSVISQSVDFRIEYFDYTGRQSEYITFLDDQIVNLKSAIPSSTCQTEINFMSYTPAYRGTVNIQSARIHKIL